jgi:glutamine amidotransferase
MIGIVDYGVGNLFSLKSSLNRLGLSAIVSSDQRELKRCDKLILPGVGAFGDAERKLRESGLKQTVLDSVSEQKPLLGICLGMQLLFEKSYEYGEHEGLSLLKGEVCPLANDIKKLKIPHMGWNSLHFVKTDSPLFRYVDEGEYVYFVHSYYVKKCSRSLVATSEYGVAVTAAVENKNVFGTQFHPEKSGDTGMRILKAFGEI